jgi:hypothetical protein
MSELETIQEAVRRAARRRRWQQGWKGLATGFFLGAVIWLSALLAYKLLPMPTPVLTIGGIVAGASAVAGLIAGLSRKISLVETARWMDQQEKLQERLSTALEVSTAPAHEEWKRLLLDDTARHAAKVDLRRLLPFGFPVVARWALLVLSYSPDWKATG